MRNVEMKSGRKRYLPPGVRTADAAMRLRAPGPLAPPTPGPFITIAQQVGAECSSLPARLAAALTAAERNGKAWQRWDDELVAKVSESRHVPVELISELETSGHSWLDDLLADVSGRTDEMIVFEGIKETIRNLAREGRAILVGHGSVYMTHDLPGGLHVRLIAPEEFRRRKVADRFKISLAQAAKNMRQLDRQRSRFFRRFWHDLPLSPEMFAATLNVAELDEDRLVKAILAMLPSH